MIKTSLRSISGCSPAGPTGEYHGFARLWIGVTQAQAARALPRLRGPLGFGKSFLNGRTAIEAHQLPDFAGVLNDSSPARYGKCGKMLQI
jgi:hypothetical protein